MEVQFIKTVMKFRKISLVCNVVAAVSCQFVSKGLQVFAIYSCLCIDVLILVCCYPYNLLVSMLAGKWSDN